MAVWAGTHVTPHVVRLRGQHARRPSRAAHAGEKGSAGRRAGRGRGGGGEGVRGGGEAGEKGSRCRGRASQGTRGSGRGRDLVAYRRRGFPYGQLGGQVCVFGRDGPVLDHGDQDVHGAGGDGGEVLADGGQGR